MWCSDEYLEHFGIKGQKWGIRRYQNEDGSLTDEGMHRYGIEGERRFGTMEKLKSGYKVRKKNDAKILQKLAEEKKNGKDIGNRRRHLEEEYMKRGYTKEQAEIAAYKRKRAETVIKIAAGVALTAAVAYGAYKGKQYLNRWGDKTIRKGSQIQRITENPDADFGKVKYVTPDKSDFEKYQGKIGQEMYDRNAIARQAAKAQQMKGIESTVKVNDIHKVTSTANAKMKIAGEKSGNKVFQDLMKNDEQFRKDFEKFKNLNGGHSDYDAFNRSLAASGKDATYDRMLPSGWGESLERSKQKFYDALKKKGYSGVIDVNDRRYSGYNAKNSTILFDYGKNMTVSNVEKLDSATIKSSLAKANQLINSEKLKAAKLSSLMGKLKKMSIVTSIFGVGGGTAALGVYNKSQNKKNAYYRTIIKEYKKEHPNTKLKDQEILDNELGR